MNSIQSSNTSLWQRIKHLLHQRSQYYSLLLMILLCASHLSVLLFYKYEGLYHVDSYDYAQIARNIYRGRGYCTDYILPLAVKHSRPGQTPNLWRAPLFPTLLALVFKFTGPQESTVILTSCFFYVLLVILTYLIGTALFNMRAGWLAALVVMATPELGAYALTGLTEPLYICLLLLVLYGAQQRWSPWLVGMLGGLAYLTRYIFVLTLLILLTYIIYRSYQQKRSWQKYIAQLVLAFCLTIAPWALRNLSLTGSPLFTLQKYEIAIFTPRYPLYTIYHHVDTCPPAKFIYRYGFQVCGKAWTYSLLTYWPYVLHFPPIPGVDPAPYLYPPGFKGHQPYRPHLWRICYHKWSLVVILALLIYLLTLVRRPRHFSYTPLLAALGLMFLLQWLVQLVIHPVARHYLPFLPPIILLLAGYWEEKHCAWPVAAVMILLGLIITFNSPHFKSGQLRQFQQQQMAMLQQYTTRNDIILTDVPAIVSWYAQRRAVWLPCSSTDFYAIERKLGKIRYCYIFCRQAWRNHLLLHLTRKFKHYLDCNFRLIRRTVEGSWETNLLQRK